MIESSEFIDLDIYPKSFPYGSLDSKSLIYDNNFELVNNTLFDDIENSSISPLSFEYLDDINEYNEALLSKLIEEFHQDPLPDTYDINDIPLDFNNNIVVNSTPVVPVCSKKRKAAIYDSCLEELDITPTSVKIVRIENSSKPKKNCNSDAAFRYRQKQKVNKSKIEEELNQSATEMVQAKTEMLEMRNKLNTIKNVVKEMLEDKGVFNSCHSL